MNAEEIATEIANQACSKMAIARLSEAEYFSHENRGIDVEDFQAALYSPNWAKTGREDWSVCLFRRAGQLSTKWEEVAYLLGRKLQNGPINAVDSRDRPLSRFEPLAGSDEGAGATKRDGAARNAAEHIPDISPNGSLESAG